MPPFHRPSMPAPSLAVWMFMPLVVPLLLAAPAASAAIVQTRNVLTADTAVSATRLVDEATAGAVPFQRDTRSQGLGPQGQLSSTEAAQQVGFTGTDGLSGVSALALALGSGVSGDASATHEAVFEVTRRAGFTLDALFEAQGNGSSDSFISLDRRSAGLDPLGELFRFDLDASPSQAFSGFLDPGFYRLTVFNALRSADPGEGGSNRLAFDFEIADAGGGGPTPVPAPATLALVLAGLGALRLSRPAAPARARAQ